MSVRSTIRPLLVALALVAGAGSAGGAATLAGAGTGALIDASCFPDNTAITMGRGRSLEISLGYDHNNDGNTLYTVHFTATMNSNAFFGSSHVFHTQDRLGGAGYSTGGIVGVPLASSSTTPLGTDTVVIEVTSDATGATVLGSCTITLTIIDPTVDSDGDGLLNGWEADGIDKNGDGTIDLALNRAPYNAKWNHKDLFVEMDYMDSHLAGSVCGALPSTSPSCSPLALHSHNPKPEAVQDVVDAFAAAPLTNPDGTGGITLHAMVDEAVPEFRWVRFTEDVPGPSNDFNDVKNGDPAVACDGSFGTNTERASSNCANILAARRDAFRYVVWGHSVIDHPAATGIAELPGNDALITVDTASLSPIPQTSRAFQAATFMHEFGHTLSLHHGGGNDTNCKPNYLSVMNYEYDSDILDYSRSALATLNEQHLNEITGIGGAAGQTARYNLMGVSHTAAANGPIDWNGNGSATQTDVAADVNYDNSESQDTCGPSPGQAALTGYDDWSHLTFDFRSTLDFSDSNPRTTPHAVADQTVAEFNLGLDQDLDGIKDGSDNCPSVVNADQANNDGDSLGDACDADDDNDGVADGADNCVLTANPDQLDTDADGLGNACDPDDDNDGVVDSADNCALTSNPDQANNDGDALGDVCDPDDDNDGVADTADNCHFAANTDQIDRDEDGRGDVCDATTFTGFTQPVDNPPTVNDGRAGRTYPVKFSILNQNGAFVTTTTAITSIEVLWVACGTFAGIPADALEATSTGGTALRYDAGSAKFVYNWSTPGTAGCYQLLVTLTDSGVHRANFHLR